MEGFEPSVFGGGKKLLCIQSGLTENILMEVTDWSGRQFRE